VASAVLSLSVDDQSSYARYGSSVEYDVVLSNSGNAAAHATVTASTPGSALDLAHATWTCVDSGTGSGCSDGNGALSQTVTLPAGHSMHWIVFVSVLPVTTDTTAELQVGETGDANATSANDVNTLVLFRYGFDPP
jgi:uncharacterized repeat protein (TIGR01451 family)